VSSSSSAARCQGFSCHCWALPPARSSGHGGGFESKFWVHAAAGSLIRIFSHAAFDGNLHPHTGLHGCRAAAPPLLQLSSMAFPCTVHQMARPRRHQSLSRIWRWRWVPDQITFCLSLKGPPCKFAVMFCNSFSFKDLLVTLQR
jgi:hypothetical protein